LEIFKPVIGFEKQYLISNKGSVYSLHCHRLMTPKKSKTGYLRITLCDNGRKRHTSVHRIVAEAFIDNPENKPTVNHKNENKHDNRVENLEWATNAEQNVYGTRIAKAKTHTDWEKRSEKMNYAEIARKHDYSRQSMCNRKQTEVYKDGVLVGVFKSQKEAADYAKAGKSDVNQCIYGFRKTANGYVFKTHFPEEKI